MKIDPEEMLDEWDRVNFSDPPDIADLAEALRAAISRYMGAETLLRMVTKERDHFRDLYRQDPRNSSVADRNGK